MAEEQDRDTGDDMSDSIKPALSPEEWRAGVIRDDEGWACIRNPQPGNPNGDMPNNGWVRMSCEECITWLHGPRWLTRRHAVAALCLYGQPFGFTREDAEILREYADEIEDGFTRRGATLRSMADRIAALLPPEQSEHTP